MADIVDQAAIDNLLALAGGDPEFVDELIDAFLSEAPRELEAIRAGVAAFDPAAVIRPAHTLKGMSLNLGAARVTELGRALEELGRAGSIDGGPVMVGALADALDELAAELAAARTRRWMPR